MDQNRFDELARLLAAGGTRRAGLRAALGAMGILGAGGLTAVDADAKRRRAAARADAEAGKRKRRRKKCKPACAAGQTCVKGACRCDDGGTVCGPNCCLAGQACQGGQCVSEPTPACIPAGEPCKDLGRECCDGRTCASGQGGETDIACYVAKTGACRTTADCIFGTACLDGRCGIDVPPAALGAPCDPALGQVCAAPGATCAAYTGAGAPDGAHCALPLRQACTGDQDCTCYRCWYSTAAAVQGGRGERASANAKAKACCHPAGQGCAAEEDCCLGLSCVDGTCAGAVCVPDGGSGCGAGTPCCGADRGSTCEAGTCVPLVCDVCASGCRYSSIAQAYADSANKPAGSTITIAPGDYPEPEFELDRNITFRRCGTTGTVTWRNGPTNAYHLILKEQSTTDVTSLTLIDLEFTKTPAGPALDQLLALSGSSQPVVRLTVTATGCTWRGFSGSRGYAAVKADQYTDLVLTDCTFEDNDLTASSYGNGAAIQSTGWDDPDQDRNVLTLTDCTFARNKVAIGRTDVGGGGAISALRTNIVATRTTFTGNIASGRGGAIVLGNAYQYEAPATATLTDCTFSGNIAGGGTDGGGAIWVSSKSTLSVQGATTITGNSAATAGSGIRVWVSSSGTTAPSRITGTTTSNVFGNISAPDCQAVDLTITEVNYLPVVVSATGYAVTCDGWCVPSGGTCNGAYATCCSGSCSAGSGDGTCP